MTGTSFSAKLGEDGKTVTLFSNNLLTNNSEKTLTVKNVKNKAEDKTIATETKTFTVTDATIPTVESITAESNKTFKVKFSEPVQTAPVAASFKIADALTTGAYGTFTVAPVTGTNNKEFRVTTVNPIPAGDIEIEVNIDGTVNDYAGYIVPTVKKTVTIVADTTAPVAESVTVNNQTEVLVTFNKEVTESTVTSAQTNFKWNTTNTTSGAKSATTAKKVDAKTYKVTFTGTNAITAGEGFFFVPAGITDISGNAIAAKSFAITTPADVAPMVESVTVPSANIIQVKYNKAMDTASVTNRSNYILKDKNGTVITTAGTLSYDSTNKLVTWSGVTLSDTEYSLNIKNVKDNILQTIVETTETFANVPSAAPTRIDSPRLITNADGTGKDVVILPFNVEVATTGVYSALNPAKWTVNGVALTTTYPNATLDINPNDAREVRIHLDTAMVVAAADDNFAINNFASSFGAIQTTPQTYTDITAAQTPLSLATNATSIKLVDNKTFELVVNRKLSAIDANEFAVIEQTGSTDITVAATNPNAIANATYANTATGSKITLTMTNVLDTTEDYRIATKAGVLGTKDIDGLAFASSATYATNAVKDFSSAITGAYMEDTQYVVVKLDQDVSGLINASDFIVKVNGVNTTVAGAVVGSSANEIQLDLGTGNVPVTSTVTVETVAQNFIQTETTGGKKIKALDSAITATNFRAVSLNLTNGAGANVASTLEIGDKVEVTFSEAVDATSLGFVAGTDKQGDNSYSRVGATLAFAVNAGVGAGNEDTITIVNNTKAIGVINMLEPTTTAVGTAGTAVADAKLSADGKTLTFTFTNLSTTAITTANIGSSKLILGADPTDVNKNKPNVDVTPQTTTRF